MDEQSIFLGALEKDTPAARAAWLAEICGDDHARRERIEALLASHEKAQSFLEQPPAGCAATIVTKVEGPLRTQILNGGLATAFTPEQAIVIGATGHSVLKSLSEVMKVPRVVLRESPEAGSGPIVRPKSPEMPERDSEQRYQLQGEIARGGMGAILKGRDADLGRDLAIKVLLDQHKDNPQIVERFIEEAQIGGQLQHPGITPVYELGQFGDHRPYFSMKLVKGETLSKLLADRAEPTADRAKLLGIFEQVCQTMAYAHSRGVIHRDLKPANVMVGAFGEVQVMDWGLAKVLPAGGVADEQKVLDQQKGHSIIQTLRTKVGSDAPGTIGAAGSHTQMGSVMGTPAYMPPEQALGEIDHLDERADVFGLGAILCEILTGLPPYIGQDGTQVFRLASRGKLTDCFQRLDQCGADADLVALTKHCLELDPKDRPRHAGVLAERITKYLESVEMKLHASETEAAVQAERIQQQQRSARKLQKMIAGLAVVSLLAIGISLVAGKFWNDAVIAQRDASLEAIRANQQFEIAQRNLIKADLAEKVAIKERDAARAAEQNALDQSYLATRSEVRALRLSRQGGWRAAALGRLQKLVKLGSRNLDLVDLRTEALACLSEMDMQLRTTIPENGYSAWHMAYSPDGRALAIEAEDRISVQDLETKREILSIASKKLAPFAFHSSGTLAVPSGEGRVKYHVVRAGQQAPPDLMGEGIAIALAFNASASRVAVIWGTAGEGTGVAVLRQAQVYSTATGESLWKTDLPQGSGYAYKTEVALSPDGSLLVTHGPNYEVHLYTVGSKQPLSVLGKVDDRICGISFHPGGALVAAAGQGVGIVWDLTSRAERYRIHAPVGGMWDMAFSPDGQLMGAVTNDGVVRFWDAHSGRELLGAPTAATSSALSMAFSPVTARFAIGGGAPRIFEIVGRNECRHDYSIRNNMGTIAFNPQQAALLAAGGDSLMHVWKPDKAAVSERVMIGDRNPQILSVSPDGHYQAIGFSGWSNRNVTDFSVSVLSGDDPTQTRQLTGPQKEVCDLAFDPQGKTLAAASYDGGLYLWDFPSGELQKRFELQPYRCQFLDNSELVVAAGNRFMVVAAGDGKVRREVTLPATIQAFLLTPDQHTAIVATHQGTLHRVQIAGAMQIEHSRYLPELSPTARIALSADGGLLIVATKRDQLTLLLDPTTLESLAQLPNVDRYLRDMKFDPDGSYLALGGSELALWDLDLVGAQLSQLGLAFGSFETQRPGPWMVDAITRTASRSTRTRLLKEAATVPELWQQLLKQAEDRPPLQLALAQFYAQQGDWEQAQRYRERARLPLVKQLEQAPDNTALATQLLEVLLPPLKTQVLVPTSQNTAITWQYTTTTPDTNWFQADFDHTHWQTGMAPFATANSSNRGSTWESPNIWLRYDFDAQNAEQTGGLLSVDMLCDDRAEVYVNGVLVAKQETFNSTYEQHHLLQDARQLLHPGKNTIAVHCINLYGWGAIDVGLQVVPEVPSLRAKQLLVAHAQRDTWAQLAAAYQLTDQQQALTELLQRHPTAHTAIADLHAAAGDWPQAIATYTMAIKAQPDDVALLIKRARALEQNDQRDLAIAEWRQIVAQSPNLMTTVLDNLTQQSRWKEAAVLVQLRVEQRPDDAISWLSAAPFLALAGDQAAYADFCQRAVGHFTKEYETPNQAEQLIKACLLRPGTVELVKRPADFLVPFLNEGKADSGFAPWAWSTRALLAYRSGDQATALEAVRKSEESRPHEFAHAMNLAVLAMAEHQLGHPEVARAALEQLGPIANRLRTDPTHDGQIAWLLYDEALALINSKQP